VTLPNPVGLIDTSVVIELPLLSAAELPTFPTISVVTLAELSVGPEVSQTTDDRRKRQLVLQQTEASFDPLPFDAACARRFAIVAGSLRQSGRKTRARAFDALIAATALAHNLPLYTCNSRDFEGITGLEVHPVEPGRSRPGQQD
jgi:tRNA(fMet)-specific endonuclease VapC